jgi:hypothetical protein
MEQRMRSCVAVALFLTLLSPEALAAGKGAKGGKKAAKTAGPNMDSTGDPTPQETSDSGPYKPTGKTGPLAEKIKTDEEVEEIVKARARDKHVVFADLVIGFGRAPIPGPASQENNWTADALSFGAVVGGMLDLSPKFSLGLRIPYSVVAIDTLVNNKVSKETTTVFGSPEIFAEYRYQLSELTTLPLLVGLGLPIAQGDPDPSAVSYTDRSKAQANWVADAANGWRDGELYQPKRVPLVLGIGIQHETKKLVFRASTKMGIGFNIGEQIVNPKAFGSGNVGTDLGTIKLYPVAFRDVTLAGVTWDAASKLWLGLDAWLAWNLLEGVKFESSATPPSPFQFVVEPKVGLRFGNVRPAASFIYPIGGRLRDSGIQGVRLHADFAF